jgi:uncharacterized damage-inducible protein DinB
MNLKDILKLYANYNKYANAEMVRILGTLPEARLHESANTYFKTVAGLLNHGLQSSANSLKRCGDNGFHSDLILPLVASFPQAAAGQPLFATLPEFSALRAKADEALIAVCAAAGEAELDRTFSFPGRDGQTRTLSFGGNLLALYSHEVHHRGGVSAILDGWGVENDWSGLMRFLFV